SEQVCVVRLVDRADVMDKLVYTATNPVKDGLVDKVHHWPGVNVTYFRRAMYPAPESRRHPARPARPGPTSYAMASRPATITQPARSGRCSRGRGRSLTP
ncbi:MAG: hypothetical protein ABIY55_08250, partial [Kofleriaceae bacterium]